MPLLVTGTVGIDTVHTPEATAEKVLGGSCSYFAAAASQLAPVRMVAAVGNDWPAEHEKQLASVRNLCMRGLERRAASSTFAWGGRYFDNMNRRETLFTHLGVLEEAPPAIPETYRDSSMVFLANTHPAVQRNLLSQLPSRRLAVADTMDLWINIAREELLALFREIDGVVLNDQEAMQLTGRSNAISAARAVLEFGLTFVIVKKGEHGAVLVHRDGVATIPAFPADERHVIDPTGAGDSFAGGLMGHLASVGTAAGGVDFAAIQAALAWGTVLASFTIESFSLDRLRRLDRSQIDERLRTFRQLARIG